MARAKTIRDTLIQVKARQNDKTQTNIRQYKTRQGKKLRYTRTTRKTQDTTRRTKSNTIQHTTIQY